MEVVPQIEALGGGVRWTIKNFSKLKSDVYSSDIFLISDCQWNVRIYPRGVGDAKDEQLSIFVYVADSMSLPAGWSRDVEYRLAVIDQLPNNKSTVKKGMEKRKLNGSSSGWGYRSFMPLTKFHDPAEGFIVDDTCIIEVEVTVLDVIPKNQGASFMLTRADVKEYPNSYAVMVEMSGLKGTHDFNVQLVDNNKALLISGDRKREKEEGVKYATAEIKFGKFSRKFSLPEDFNPDSIRAIYEHGMLTVTGDKLDPKKPRTIDIQIVGCSP
ncbi:protein RESTRICTED TEV MOVEMENT 3-like [Tasmannia lanceolata]|uniref:protein RESTRICTED TEV MOVEMENT 3-like n=1 Tax=Tasmannia lanceolata TaxID=3420 RepID=UPI0040638BB6